MFGIDDALLAAGISGGANLLGGWMKNEAQAGAAQGANAMNMAMQLNQQAYNSMEAGIARDFNAQQAERSRTYSADMMREANQFSAGQAERARTWDFDVLKYQNQYNHDEAIHNRAFTAGEAERSRTWNSYEAALARKFSEDMANSAWQRGTADMRKAGINPMVAYMKGGADTPGAAMGTSSPAGGSAASSAGWSGARPQTHMASGSTASAGAASGSAGHALMPVVDNIVAGAVSSALDAARTSADTKLRNQQLETERENTKLREEQTKREEQEKLRTVADRRRLDFVGNREYWQGARDKQDYETYSSDRGKMMRDWGNLGGEMGRMVSTAEGVANIIKAPFSRRFGNW